MRHLILFLASITSIGLSDISTPLLLDLTIPPTAILMRAGVANEVYLIDSLDSGPHILKVFNKKTIEELERAESLLQLVRNAGIRAPESLVPPTQVGSKVISVFSYVNGRHIDESHLPETAKLMAKLHTVETLEAPLSPAKDYSRLFKSCKDWKYCEQLLDLFTSLDLSYRDDLPRGLIHGDFSYTNLLVDDENNLTLLDFDHLRNDLLLTDLVRCHLFYGFNEQGQLKEETVRSFTLAYNAIRPLKAIEKDAFYTHMKLCLIDAALEMYDHMYVQRDLPVYRVDGNPYNACLTPDLIAKEVLSIQDKTSIALDPQPYPIFFFGLSGVGKTSLIHLLNESSDLFYIPKFTVTREPRDDDDPRYFEYLSVDEFIRLKERGEFFVWMNQQETYYGYRFAHLTLPSQYPLMNASAYGIDAVSQLKGIKVLIEGDAQQGLELRKNSHMEKTREKTNRIVQERFFNQNSFREKMDLIYFNQFGNLQESAAKLKKQILEEMDDAN
jgi:Ser/Thr protein kinase RdoA (MazF antagonist)/guanylate kinase